jgi:hypothetical protein
MLNEAITSQLLNDAATVQTNNMHTQINFMCAANVAHNFYQALNMGDFFI